METNFKNIFFGPHNILLYLFGSGYQLSWIRLVYNMVFIAFFLWFVDPTILLANLSRMKNICLERVEYIFGKSRIYFAKSEILLCKHP